MEQTLARGQLALPACHYTSYRGLPAPHGRLRSGRQPQVFPSARLADAAGPCKYVKRRSTVARAISAPTVDRPAAASGDAKDYEGGLQDCVVVGAGISGLVTAQAFVAEHADTVKKFLVTEGRERVGGNITSLSGNGYRWEEGPSSFQPNDAMLKAAVDAGIAEDLVFGDPKAPRFVFWNKKLRPTPSGPDVLTFDLLSIWGKIRAGLGAAGIKKPLPEHEESVEEYVRRNLGAEVFERLIEPFCSGVYAGNPAKLSMKAAFGKVYDLEKKGGSIIAGVLQLMREKKANPGPARDARLPPKPAGQTVGSFREGLQMLPEAIAKNLQQQIRTNWKLKEIEKAQDGTYNLYYDTPEGSQKVRTRSVALTVPAYTAADLVRRDCPDASMALKSLDYPPVAAVTVSYPMSAIKQDRLDESRKLPGFGQLHPRSQGITTLGTIYSSSLFPGRAPDGQQQLLCYIGGATNRSIVSQPEDDIVKQVDKDLRQMLIKEDAPPAKKIGVRVWPKAIPQFNVGHLEVVQGAKEDLASAGYGGILLGGNYVAGVALGKCVEYGYEYAKEIAKYLNDEAAVAQTDTQGDAFFV
ncbi:g11727 [Coccomyxa viridis]|uniref:Protoporphyrinogen oxidase n=1 Tax=Coccomyxa viridis TaxID=1274662 RepID=A0ABP1GBA5_9CHLO